ncbi:hypothetical protein FOXG_18007 [Fusarium oxysporum f. sp. lycopersici 4287]|uniref:Uncharacterized protein n=1 Tax=Fusarium oxysporum f. sp. lycopersici (strain 4287 / CBS 123668 / FGSC 9935 / NRRL 34936) TaxID=426428 RepID=A0A0J9U9N4_FUSO4|nr:hypothetical protein FOXG_18007 [Fusarium oxysporum f. sp. lycopersici 4287]KNA95537.1 hypothetical protein FOXG_18007 [Fusarium oxysporum f. sp. lycopersici 4287]
MLKGGGGELRGKLSLAGPPSDAASAGNRIKEARALHNNSDRQWESRASQQKRNTRHDLICLRYFHGYQLRCNLGRDQDKLNKTRVRRTDGSMVWVGSLPSWPASCQAHSI